MSLQHWEKNIWELNLPIAKAWQIIRMIRRHIDVFKIVKTNEGEEIKRFQVKIPIKRTIMALYRMHMACKKQAIEEQNKAKNKVD